MTIYKPRVPDIMTVADVCEIINISRNHCCSLLKSNKLKGFKVNESRAWRISKIALYDYLGAREF